MTATDSSHLEPDTRTSASPTQGPDTVGDGSESTAGATPPRQAAKEGVSDGSAAADEDNESHSGERGEDGADVRP